MEIYDRSSWRQIPREGECALSLLLGGECSGLLSLHHLTPLSEGGDDEHLVLCCNRHHQLLHGARNRSQRPQERRCRHRHVYPGSREACERRLLQAA